jgi:hypothetical protein
MSFFSFSGIFTVKTVCVMFLPTTYIPLVYTNKYYATGLKNNQKIRLLTLLLSKMQKFNQLFNYLINCYEKEEIVGIISTG